jgi:hypothetical protein
MEIKMKKGENIYFSPEYKFSDLEWDNKESLIQAFCDRVNGYYLKPCEKLGEEKEVGFAMGVLCITTIDFLARISTGIGQTKKRIKKWLLNNIEEFKMKDPNDEKKTLSDRFYEDFRNGIVHEGRIKRAGQFSFESEILSVENGIIVVNPKLLLREITEAFEKYIHEIKNDKFAFEKFRCSFINDFHEDFELATKE